LLFKTATSRNIFSVVAVGVIATVATASTLFVMAYQETKASSIAKMTASAHASAAEIERSISTGMQTVYTMRDAMQAMAANRLGDRPAADRMLAEIKKNSPDLLGIWTGWEPDAFDGRDFAFAGKRAHDATGRYIPYVTSGEGGRLQFSPLEGYADPVEGAYYQLAFTQNKTIILEPFTS
jgi:methyl-accepting chemotaxis protein